MKPCGTWAAYQRHRRNGEAPCDNCREASARYQRERYNYEPRNVGKPCAVCANELGLGKRKYCSDACAMKAFTDSPAYRRAQAKRNSQPRQKVERTCLRCEKAWKVEKHSRSLFCSIVCAKAGTRRERGLVHVGAVPFTWLPPQHPVVINAKPAKPRIWCAGDCAWCDTPFVVVDQVTAKFCSATCARASGRRDRGRFAVPPAFRVAIYERDGWVCQLCTEPVDPDLMTVDPFGDWAPSLDHVVPQSKGGGHGADNLQLAHRWCNAVRGDDTYHGVEFFAAA